MKFYLVLSLSLFLILLQVLPTEAASLLKCVNLFSESQMFALQVPMQPQYRNENLGHYFDKVTCKHWHVKYFNDQEKSQFTLTALDSRLINTQKQKASSIFDYESGSFKEGLIVLDIEKNLLFLPYELRGVYHHSSLTAGQNVLFAGTLTLSDGIVLAITDLSGHYKPSSQSLVYFIQHLEDLGLNLKHMKISGHHVLNKTGQHSLTYDEWKKQRFIF